MRGRPILVIGGAVLCALPRLGGLLLAQAPAGREKGAGDSDAPVDEGTERCIALAEQLLNDLAAQQVTEDTKLAARGSNLSW